MSRVADVSKVRQERMREITLRSITRVCRANTQNSQPSPGHIWSDFSSVLHFISTRQVMSRVADVSKVRQERMREITLR
ncbi:uncharacterized, partial [Tachysurus ichikawai]